MLAGIDHELPVQHLGGHKQRVEGALIGGNLTALACMAGTLGGLHAPAGSILVLEDVGEPYYRLERSLWQLLESIDARQLGAICLGSFTDCPRKEVAHSLERIFGEYAAAIECRSTTTCPAGMVRRTEPGLTGRPRCSRETGCAGRDGARPSP